MTPSGGRQAPSYIGFLFSFIAVWRFRSSSSAVQVHG
jgi:hypothetical protein